jgi:hypothetical protein
MEDDLAAFNQYLRLTFGKSYNRFVLDENLYFVPERIHVVRFDKQTAVATILTSVEDFVALERFGFHNQKEGSILIAFTARSKTDGYFDLAVIEDGTIAYNDLANLHHLKEGEHITIWLVRGHRAIVHSAVNYYDFSSKEPDWYIEWNDQNGKHGGYWKQSMDGGHITLGWPEESNA